MITASVHKLINCLFRFIFAIDPSHNSYVLANRLMCNSITLNFNRPKLHEYYKKTAIKQRRFNELEIKKVDDEFFASSMVSLFN